MRAKLEKEIPFIKIVPGHGSEVAETLACVEAEKDHTFPFVISDRENGLDLVDGEGVSPGGRRLSNQPPPTQARKWR
jgi:hypothetical protein